MKKPETAPHNYALVVCNGDLPSRLETKALARNAGFILCADGGANRARRAGVRPDMIVGDLDSISPVTRRAFARVPTKRITDQYSTDLEKALTVVVARGYREGIVIGATGRRPDHTMANYSILKKYRRRLHLRYVDRYCDNFLVERAVSFEAPPGRTVSLSPLGRCEGVTTEGLLYPLKNAVLELGVREGESNAVVASPVKVRVRRGSLLLFLVKRR